MAALQVRSLEDLQQLLGHDNTAVQQLQRLFQLAEGYGYRDWLVFDASIVRGLAYYTGQLCQHVTLSSSSPSFHLARLHVSVQTKKSTECVTCARMCLPKLRSAFNGQAQTLQMGPVHLRTA